MRDFAAKVIVITGAGSGIGRALALKLANKGAFVAISDIDKNSVEATAQMITDLGGRAHAARLDVADRQAFYAYADQVIAQYGRVDVVINNAGVTVNERIEEMTYDDFEWIMSINFWGVVYGTKAFLPHLKQSRDACIVNVSSLFGLIAFPTQGAYNASKFAVKGFTEALRYELMGSSVTPICVHPGGIDTDILKHARFHQLDTGETSLQEAIEQFRRVAWTRPDQAADSIINAIRHKSRRVLIGPDAMIMDLLGRLFPSSYDRLIGFFLKQKWLRRS